MNKIAKIIFILVAVLLMSLLNACGTRTIFEAVENGDVDTVKIMLDKDPSLLKNNNKPYLSLFRRAVLTNQIPVMELLLQRGAEIDAHFFDPGHGFNGVTPFLLAVHSANIQTMEWLIQKGANIHAITGAGDNFSNAINMAVSSGSLEKVKRLLQLGVEVGTSEKGFYNPLIGAVLRRNIEMAKLLLENGATLTINNQKRNTLLHWAVSMENIEGIRLLLDYGANVNARNGYGRIPLHNLQYWHKDRPEITAMLLEKGSDLNARGKDGNTPLHQAARNRCTASARLMLEKGARVDIPGYKNRTPLGSAVENIANGVIRLLTSLHRAAAEGDLEKVKTLYKKYPQLLDARDQDQRTPLHHAAMNNRRQTAAFLIDKGADIQAVSKFRRVALVKGVIARLLVPKNGRVKTFVSTKTPLELALEHHHNELAGFLKSRGAKTAKH